MSLFTGIAIYLTLWWTTLFAVLPLGTVTHADAGIDCSDGRDPASPVNPNLKRKFLTTTWISAVAFAILWAVLHFHLIRLDDVPWRGQ